MWDGWKNRAVISGTEPAALSYEHIENSTKDLEESEISDIATPWTNFVFRAYYLQGV